MNNSLIELLKGAFEKLTPLFLGMWLSKNNAKDNANDLIKKAKKSVSNHSDNDNK